MQAAARRKWPVQLPSATELAVDSCDPGRCIRLPQSVREVEPKDMLLVYERMRRVVFGGRDKTWPGVHAITPSHRDDPNDVRTHRAQHTNTASISAFSKSPLKPLKHKRSWLSVVGGGNIPEQPVSDMGRFIDVLARKEALRNPLLLDQNKEEEDSLQGLMRRKLAVDFGSRYKNGEKSVVGVDSMGGMEIETNQGVKILREEAVKTKEEIDKERAIEIELEIATDKERGDQDDAQITSILEEADNLFMDTPMPPLETDADSDEFSDLNYSPMTDGDDDRDDEYHGEIESSSGIESDTESEKRIKINAKISRERIEDGRVGLHGTASTPGVCNDGGTIDNKSSTSSSSSSSSPSSAKTGQSEGSWVQILDSDTSKSLSVDTARSVRRGTDGDRERDRQGIPGMLSPSLSPSIFTTPSSPFASSSPLLPSTNVLYSLPPLGNSYAAMNGKRKRSNFKKENGIAALGSGPNPIDLSNPPLSLPSLPLTPSTSSSGDMGLLGRERERERERDDSVLGVKVQIGGERESWGIIPNNSLPTPNTPPSGTLTQGLNTAPDNDILPPGWVRRVSTREKKNYWFNLNTGQSVWTKPTM
jgi:WW domain